MITSIHFENFKALRDATLPLGRFTLIVGPNGSGKSTALQALQSARTVFPKYVSGDLLSAGSTSGDLMITLHFGGDPVSIVYKFGWRWERGGYSNKNFAISLSNGGEVDVAKQRSISEELEKIRIFSFDPQKLAAPVPLVPNPTFDSDGSNLVAVLDALRDKHPDRFRSINSQIGRWLPEFDEILFDTPEAGKRALLLRTRIGHHAIKAADLSQGTLFALAFLTLAYLPTPPSIIGIEEPERGIHPRLLRRVQDAMYRLCYPEDHGDDRDPVQVIATTHSPYLLDLYKDHPDEIVIAEKDQNGVRFQRLSDITDETLLNEPLGDLWYSGIFGGVPANS